jgi:ABC-2 type transport system ATP-binding protein
MTGNTAPPPLLVRNLRKRYADVIAVNGLDLEIRAGECFGLLGPNGAGKTTTIEICEGLTEPDEGEVLVLGRRWGEDDRELRELLGISLQETQFSEKLTVNETIELFRSFYDRGPAPAEVIGMVQLQEKGRSRVGTLSGGQKQRLALACALVGDPELLFLDEPTTGFDPNARRQAWQMFASLRELGKTVFLTTHYMDEAQALADRVAIIVGGEIVAVGTPGEIGGRGGEATISFALPAGAGELPPGVGADAQVSNGRVTLTTSERVPTLNALTGWALERGVELDDLEVHGRSLEDVYLELTEARE